MPAIRRAEVDAHSGERTDPDVPKRDRKLLVLKPQLPLGKVRVVNVERRFAVQHDDEMVAIHGDLVAIPVVGLERVLPRGLGSSDDGASVVPGGLLPPDLDFVAAAFLRGAYEDAAIRVRTALEFDRQREVLVASIGGQVACRRPARRGVVIALKRLPGVGTANPTAADAYSSPLRDAGGDRQHLRSSPNPSRRQSARDRARVTVAKEPCVGAARNRFRRSVPASKFWGAPGVDEAHLRR